MSRVLSVRVRVRGESLTDTITKKRDRLHAARARIRKKYNFRGELRWGLALTVPGVLKEPPSGHFLRRGSPPRHPSEPRHKKRHHGKPMMHRTHCQAAKATRRAQRLPTAGAREARCQREVTADC